jgi:hypothetical protein
MVQSILDFGLLGSKRGMQLMDRIEETHFAYHCVALALQVQLIGPPILPLEPKQSPHTSHCISHTKEAYHRNPD